MTVTAFPKARPTFACRPESVLLLCYYEPRGISTVPENVAFLQTHSRFSVTVFNLCEHRAADGPLSLPAGLDLRGFDALVIHNSLSYNVDNLRALDRLLRVPIKELDAVKILMKQDENFRFQELAEYVGETGFDVVFTCLPKEAVPLVYPESVVGRPVFARMLTGYVTPTLRGLSYPLDQRPIDIGYRGSIQPLSFGRLAYEKRKIGDDVERLLADRGLVLDISSRWEDRLGSGGWFDFLGRCKATLGAESGASIFDLDGDLDARCAAAEQALGGPSEDPDYAERFLARLSDLEGNVYYNQISPRHFEAAATGTLQIMFPGTYSGIFVAGRHYVELARDYSNLYEVVEILKDDRRRREIVECARAEIIDSSGYAIETFVRDFDRRLAAALSAKGRYAASSLTLGGNRSNVLVICAHRPTIDPRLDWVSRCAPPDMRITQVGVLLPNDKDPWITRLEEGRALLARPRMKFTPEMLGEWYAAAGDTGPGWAALAEIEWLARIVAMDDETLLRSLGAPIGAPRIATFRWYLDYVLSTTATLMAQLLSMRGFRLIVATDLDSLPAAILCKGIFGVPVLYDAHEYWPESDVNGLEFEVEFWGAREKSLVQHVDYRQTVSPGIAELMKEQYGRDFAVVPNCQPLDAASESATPSVSSDGLCRFLYQGNFAPMRGVDLLIQGWPSTHESAVLLLRGPDNDYKKEMIRLARKGGLLGTRIQFPPPVTEAELTRAAQEGDVGLLPYAPAGANYTHCSPNKVSQYMAAGLPMLANRTSFVAEILKDSQAGLVIDFSRPEQLAEAVAQLVEDPGLRLQMGARASAYYRDRFNWGVVSGPMYAAIKGLLPERSAGALRVYPIREPLRWLPKRKATPTQPMTWTPPPTHRGPVYRGARALWRCIPARLRLGMVGAARKVLGRG